MLGGLADIIKLQTSKPTSSTDFPHLKISLE